MRSYGRNKHIVEKRALTYRIGSCDVESKLRQLAYTSRNVVIGYLIQVIMLKAWEDTVHICEADNIVAELRQTAHLQQQATDVPKIHNLFTPSCIFIV